LKDVRDEDEALNKATDADSKSYGVKGQLQREGDLSCSIKIHPHFDEVPPEQGEKPDSKESRDNVDDVPYPFRKLENKEIHKHMAFEKGGKGDSETDHDGAGKGDQFIGADDRPAKGPQDDIRYRQEHHEGDGDSCDDIEELAESVDLVDYRLHEAPLLDEGWHLNQTGKGWIPSLPLTFTSEVSSVLLGRI
jgi:hypothetical protein